MNALGIQHGSINMIFVEISFTHDARLGCLEQEVIMFAMGTVINQSSNTKVYKLQPWGTIYVTYWMSFSTHGSLYF